MNLNLFCISVRFRLLPDVCSNLLSDGQILHGLAHLGQMNRYTLRLAWKHLREKTADLDCCCWLIKVFLFSRQFHKLRLINSLKSLDANLIVS